MQIPPLPAAPEPEREGERGPVTARLAAAARSGDQQAFCELYERIAPALFAWAELRIRPEMRGRVEPQDLLQEVWCRAWRAVGELDVDAQSFRYWIFRIAKNVMLEAFRKLRTQASGSGDTQRLLLLRDVPDSATGVSRRVARDESLALFARWASGLEEDERTLLLHCGLEGLPHAEVAERMDLSREAVSKRWQRLRQRIEEQRVPRELLADV